MQFDPKWVFWLGVIVTVETAIGQGAVSLTNVFPDAWVPFIKGWSSLLSFVGTAFMTAMSGYSSRTAGPLVNAPVASAIDMGKKLVLAFLMLWVLVALSAGGKAHAADLPTLPLPAKLAAKTPDPCTVTNCSGWYAGVNLTGVMTNANVIGNGVNGSVAAGGQSIGAQFGYQFSNGTWFFGPEVSANYVVNGNPNVTGGAPAPYRIGEYLKVGTALSSLLNLPAAATGTPGIPAALANAVISPYVLFGAVQSGIGQGWATGAGVEFVLAQNWFLDTRYTYINYGSASVSPAEVAKSENLVTVGINYKF